MQKMNPLNDSYPLNIKMLKNISPNHKFIEYGMDDDFVNINFSDSVSRNLMNHQTLHVMNLISCIKKGLNAVAFDGSSTGTGKTYTALALCAHLGLRPLIVCPKSVICTWKSVAKIFGVQPIAIANYESLRRCTEYDDSMKRVESKHVVKCESSYAWKVDARNTIIIFDEAHKCKNKNSLNGKLMLSAKGVARILLLSATISEKPNDFFVFGYMLGFYDTVKKGGNWINDVIREEKNKLGKDSVLSRRLYPDKGSRMSLEDLGCSIPVNNIVTQCYTLDESSVKKIKKEYLKIQEITRLGGSSGSGSGSVNNGSKLVEINKSREIIEEMKIPIIIEQAEDYLETDKSVVVFVNFIKSLTLLKAHFDSAKIPYSSISGDQDIETRKQMIDNFQKNKVRIILCMIQAGGESISLNDCGGKHPRVSLISPSFSGVQLVQALGRIYRAGTTSRVTQKLIFCDQTYEEKICEKIKQKIQFMNNLSDSEKFDASSFDATFDI
jgi:SNF2 family DNA or RNA helicase